MRRLRARARITVQRSRGARTRACRRDSSRPPVRRLVFLLGLTCADPASPVEAPGFAITEFDKVRPRDCYCAETAAATQTSSAEATAWARLRSDKDPARPFGPSFRRYMRWSAVASN